MMHPLLCNPHIVLVQKLHFSLQFIISEVTSSDILFCLTVRTLAAWLQMRSDGADVAGIARYLTASLSKFLNLWADDFHQERGQLKALVSVFCIFILRSFLRRSWYNSFSHNIFAVAVSSWSSGVASLIVLRSPPMLYNKMSSMLVVSVGRGKSGRGGSENSSRLMD